MSSEATKDVSELTDEEIVDRVLAGERRLFEQLMRRQNRRVYRTSRAILRDEREAEDVMQDTYVRAFAHLSDFAGKQGARFSTWLTKIAVHEAFARLRRARRHESLDSMSDHQREKVIMSSSDDARAPREAATPEQSASDGEMNLILERAIGELPEDFRVVFMLRAVEEMSGVETAECLGIPEDTVKTRLHRARGRLQEILLAELEPKATRAFAFEAPRCDRVVAAVLHRLGIDASSPGTRIS